MKSILHTSHAALACLLLASCAGSGGAGAPYALTVDGKAIEVHECTVSAAPINQVWPGYQRPADQTEPAWFAYWDIAADGSTVEIDARRFSGDVKVSPASAGIVPQVTGGKVTLRLDCPRNITVEFGGSGGALHLFANPTETDIPSPGDPGVIYYGPGTHEAGTVKLHSGDRVYVAPGAVVYGNFYAIDAEDIRIYGRGVIDGSRQERGDGSSAGFSGCSNITVEGVIMLDPSMWCTTFYGCDGVLVDNIKLVGLWRYNADGIDVVNSSNVTVCGCFVRSFDDGFIVKGLRENLGEPERMLLGEYSVRNVLFEDCTVWCDWGHGFGIGAETYAPVMKDIVFRNIDVVRTTHAVMCVVHGDKADIGDILIEDIRVEVDDYYRTPVFQTHPEQVYKDTPDDGYMPVLMNLLVEKSMWSQGEDVGPLAGVTIRNVTVNGNHILPSIIKGLDKEHSFRGVTIENLVMGRKKIATLKEGNITVGDFVEDVTIK